MKPIFFRHIGSVYGVEKSAQFWKTKPEKNKSRLRMRTKFPIKWRGIEQPKNISSQPSKTKNRRHAHTRNPPLKKEGFYPSEKQAKKNTKFR